MSIAESANYMHELYIYFNPTRDNKHGYESLELHSNEDWSCWASNWTEAGSRLRSGFLLADLLILLTELRVVIHVA